MTSIKIMKKIVILSLLSSLAITAASAVTFSGTAVGSVTNATGGNSSFIVVDTGDNGFDFGPSSLGLILTSGSFIGGTDDFIIGYNSVVSFVTTTVPGNASFTLDTDGTPGAGSDLDENTAFYIITFGTKSGDGITTQAGDTFGISSEANWLLPASNAANPAFGSAFTQAASVDGASATIVPEPSSFALLAGCFGLAWVMVRRRS
jgi:hypothetical protein